MRDLLDPFEEAELRADMRDMYRKIGFEDSLRCLAEIMKSAEILAEIILEERKKEQD